MHLTAGTLPAIVMGSTIGACRSVGGPMVDTLFFVHTSEQDPNAIAAAYQLRGWNIAVAGPYADDALERMAVTSPVAAVFCLDGDCASDVTAFAEHVLADERTNKPLMVFVGGEASDIAAARTTSPYGIFVRADELPWVLKRLIPKY